MPAGEAYSRVENAKGELGYYCCADGSPTAYRYHVRSPSFINLTALEAMCLGHTIADVVGILGSLDIVLGEVDRDLRPWCRAGRFADFCQVVCDTDGFEG